MKRLTALGLVGGLALAVGCGDDDSTIPESGRPDSGAALDAGVVAEDAARMDAALTDAGAGAAPEVRCVAPRHGAMLAAEPGATTAFVAAIRPLDRVRTVTIDGAPALPDDFGLVGADVPVRFGVQSVTVDVGLDDGTSVRQICDFLAAPRFHSPSEPLADAVTTRLGPTALADADGTDAMLESLDDVLSRAITSGAVTRRLTVTIPSGDTFPPPPPCCSDFVDRVGYLMAAVSGGGTVAIEPTPGSFHVAGGPATVRIDLDVTVRLDTGGGEQVIVPATGYVEIAVDDPGVTLSLSIAADGTPTVSVLDAPSRLRGTVTAFMTTMAPIYDARVAAVVAAWVTADSRVVIAPDPAVELDLRVADLFDRTLASAAPVAPASFALPTVSGGTVGLLFESSLTSFAVHGDSVVLGFGTRYVRSGGALRGGLPSLGVPLDRGAIAGVTTATEPVATMVSEGALNQVLHATWQAGGIDGAVGPDMVVGPDMITGPGFVVGPDMIVGPDMLGIDAALPMVVDLGAGQATVTMGGMTATMTGAAPYGSDRQVRFAATAHATVRASSGATPDFTVDRLDALSFASDGVALSGADSDTVRNFTAALAVHLATFALDRTTPPAPLLAFEAPSAITTAAGIRSTGIAAGTRLGTRAPTARLTSGLLEIAGAMGQLP